MRNGQGSERAPARNHEGSLVTTTAREARCISDLAKQLDAVCQAAIEVDACKRLEVMTALAVVLWQHAEDAGVELSNVSAYLLALGEHGHRPEFWTS
jgi:hypothetical protein